MIRVYLKNETQESTDIYGDGPLEFGRSKNLHSEDRPAKKVVVQDKFSSRHHARLEKKRAGWVLLTNLSEQKNIELADQKVLPGESVELSKPTLSFWIGKTWVEIDLELESQEGLATLPVALQTGFDNSMIRKLRDIETPTMDLLTQWFETIISVQRSAAGTSEFSKKAAEAAVELIGFDHSLVLSCENEEWQTKGASSAEAERIGFSKTILRQVLIDRKTFYQAGSGMRSIADGTLAAAAPVFDSEGDEIVGAVYGSRAIEGAQSEISPLNAQLLQTLAGVLSLGIVREKHEKVASDLRATFDQFFTPKLARQLEEDPQLLEGKEREVTVLFGDLRDFTKLSGRLSPRETCNAITDVLECMTEAIRATDGVVIDYAGDGILAIWNAPTDQPNHVDFAATTALRIIRDLPHVSKKWEGRIDGPFQVGLGINTGDALVGNTGTKYKFKYGAIGQPVNLASRIESATKKIGVSILLSEYSQEKLDAKFKTRRLPKIGVPGVAEPFRVYELNEGASPDWGDATRMFELALSQFEEKQWGLACQTIQPLLFSGANGVGDPPSLSLASLAIKYLQAAPEHFDGVLDLRKK